MNLIKVLHKYLVNNDKFCNYQIKLFIQTKLVAKPQLQKVAITYEALLIGKKNIMKLFFFQIHNEASAWVT